MVEVDDEVSDAEAVHEGDVSRVEYSSGTGADFADVDLPFGYSSTITLGPPAELPTALAWSTPKWVRVRSPYMVGACHNRG